MKLLCFSGLRFESHHAGGEVVIRTVPYCLNADGPMKADVICQKHPTGFDSCPLCVIKGESVTSLSGKGSTRVKVLTIGADGDMEDCEPRVGAQLTEGIRAPGQTGYPSMQRLLGFDVYQCSSIDSMHVVFRGVFRAIFTLWFFTPGHPSYVGPPGRKLADSILSGIRHMESIMRGCRMVDSHKDWKASEFRNWGYLYSPIVMEALVRKGKFAQKFYAHWLLLLEGVALLDSEAITVSMIERADFCLRRFVMLIPELYGKNICTTNYHLLLHLPESVRFLGPLWRTSLFAHESFNQMFLKARRPGSKGQLFQIIERFQWIAAIPKLYSLLKPLKPDSPAYKIADKLTFNSISSASAKPIGKALKIARATLQASWNAINGDTVADELARVVSSDGYVDTFFRARIKGKVYTTAEFDSRKEGKMRRSVLGFDSNFGEIVSIIVSEDVVYLAVNLFSMLSPESCTITLPYAGQFNKSNQIIIRKALDLKCFQALLVESDNLSIVARLPNYMESS